MTAAFRVQPPPACFAQPSLRAVLEALPGARVVGGAVRDLLLERTVADFDVATPQPPERVMAALAAAGLKVRPTGLQHGTVTAISGGEGFEVTTLRRDARTDGRHAEVVWTDDWREDAARRDFTINAMSMQADGAVFDYFGGLADLRDGRVRFVGEPSARIAEDYLRILRFYRFQGRYGRVAPDAVTMAALRDGTPGLAQLSAERVWSELKQILLQADPGPVLRLMQALGTLGAVLPGRTDLPGFTRLIERGLPGEAVLRLAALHPGQGSVTGNRLRLSRLEAEELLGCEGPPPSPGWNEDDLRRALADTNAADLRNRAWLADDGSADWEALRIRLAMTGKPRFPLFGRDVLAAGVPPGPRVGEVLASVREWWLKDGCWADALACRAELARRLPGSGG